MKQLFTRIQRLYPKFDQTLAHARMKVSAQTFIKRAVINSLGAGSGLSILLFFLLDKMEITLVWLLPWFFLVTFSTFQFFMHIPNVYIARKTRAIDKNILFAGQYLLVKIESGEPLFNSLEGVAKSFGETGKAFREMVQYIEFGDSIEKAIDRAVMSSPSKNFQRLLWELSNSMKTGTDIKRSLKAILADIHNHYLIEIEKYGKKLSSISLFYMVLGIIVPSLGMTMFVVISSFIQISVPFSALMVILFILIVIHLMFISIFNSIRPAVDI